MPIKTPKFWYREDNSQAPLLIEKLLWPLSILYAAGNRLNLSRHLRSGSPAPVICVGNMVAGGSGKTPTLLALHKLIKAHNVSQMPFFLSRGYGGSEEGPHRVTSGHDTVQRVGDEPFLLAKAAETVISANRIAGATLAHSLGADLILMDDGFQNHTIDKDVSFLVIDGAMGFGNRKLLPCGPLREPITEGISRADAIILIGVDQRGIKKDVPDGLPIFEAKLLSHFDGERNKPYIAFCGLAQPEKFKKTLIQEGLSILGFYDYPDHHVFTAAELDTLIAESKAKNAVLITTEKDFVRIPLEYHGQIKTLPIEIIFEDPSGIVAFLKNKIERHE